MSDDAAAATARAYRRFADEEVRGCSPLYEDLARQVAGDREILDFLLTLPREKRQPNLLLAALRSLAGTPSGWPEFRRAVLSEGDRLREVMLARSTQTNEPGRCATLLPVLARLPPPLALIEIGASAGLCLIPDRYGYDYGGRIVEPSVRRGDAPVFPCDANAATPIPAACPEIVWRAGLDLEPIDVRDPAETAWLETLVWPEQTERLGRLRQSLAIAAGDPPRVIRGDLRRDLPALAREAPKDATMVIFHTAVLLYVGSAVERADFARLATELCDFWIANEPPGIVPQAAVPSQRPAAAWRYLVSVGGAAVAWSHPHGAALEWIADPPRASPRM
jgi:hypothetical protein